MILLIFLCIICLVVIIIVELLSIQPKYLRNQKIQLPQSQQFQSHQSHQSQHITGGHEIDEVKREYNRYIIVYKIRDQLYKISESPKIRYELDGILERFTIAVANKNILDLGSKSDGIFYKIGKDDDALQKMIGEIKEKNFDKFISSMMLDDIISGIINLINDFVENPTLDFALDFAPGVNTELKINEGTIEFGKYKYQMLKRRIECLRKRAKNYLVEIEKSTLGEIELSELIDKKILIMLLRYESLYPQGNQWGFSEKMYQNLRDNFDVKLEAFASPKNSQTILLGDDAYFCSLFYDTDKYFGSIGSFFDCDFIEFANRPEFKLKNKKITIMAGPPYLEKLMNDVMDKILSTFEKAPPDCKLHIIFNGPAWKDARYYIDAMNSKYKKYDEFQEKGKHYYINTNTVDSADLSADEKAQDIIGFFNSHIFVFANFDSKNTYKYENITLGYRIELNPPIIIEEIESFKVVRDDFLPGGTKQRAWKMFTKEPYSKFREIVYAGPYNGYAQVALGVVCRTLGKTATVIMTRDDYKTNIKAKSYGVNIKKYPNKTLEELQNIASDYVKRQNQNKNSNQQSYLMPFGFNSDEFKRELAAALNEAIDKSDFKLDKLGKNTFWLVGGSATLASVLYLIFPNSYFNVVQVGKTIWPDQINDRTKIYISDEKFYQDAAEQPPYDSASSYDAKLWKYAKKYGKKGDIIWNVAGN